MQAEDMTFEHLKEVVDGLICRPCDAVTTAEQPLGTFNIITFPMEEISSTDNPLVHCFDLIADLEGEVNISELGRLYKQACEKSGLQLMPPPFGSRECVPANTKLQFIM